jgi:uncharacterized OB-fold protein
VTSTVVTCATCGRVLGEDPSLPTRPPCPDCGSTARNVHVQVADRVEVSDEIAWVTRAREFVRHNPFWLAVSIVLALAGLVIGTWLLSGWLSFVVGLVLAAIGLSIGPLAVTRVVERDHTGPFR